LQVTALKKLAFKEMIEIFHQLDALWFFQSFKAVTSEADDFSRTSIKDSDGRIYLKTKLKDFIDVSFVHFGVVGL